MRESLELCRRPGAPTFGTTFSRIPRASSCDDALRTAPWKTRSMDLGDLIGFEAVLPSLRAGNKKQVLQELAARAARITDLDERDVFERLTQRERLGSTGVGHGVAVPHATIEALDRTVALFARLERPIDFEATDGQPVDLIVTLLSPAGAGADHLKALARIARVMRNATFTAKLRACRDPHALYALLVHSVEPDAA